MKEHYTLQELESIRIEANERFPTMKLKSIRMYQSTSGVLVNNRIKKQWVFFPGKDGLVYYDWSLWQVLAKLKKRRVNYE